MNNVSPIRSKIHGQSNVPMTYSGPPNQQELNRNRNRKDPNRRSFEFGYECQQDRQIQDGAGIRRRKDLSKQNNNVAMNYHPSQVQGVARRRN